MGITYKDSGVDINGANSFVKKIAPIVKATFSKSVITDIGGFGALFSGSFPDLEDPVLVSGTDGVGTKLKVAHMMNKHDTIGIDAVAMCVNDIITCGARPLFFLDYISCGILNEDVLVAVVSGIAEGCKQADCSLIGGETAEHPNVMDPDDYDIAGFAVGVVDRKKIIDGHNIAEGDVIIGLPSSGLHSNGYSLVRKIFFEIKNYPADKKISQLSEPLGMTLLSPTRIYSQCVNSCIDSDVKLNGIVHITGGGFYENIPRVLPDFCAARIDLSSFTIPAIFHLIQKDGDVETVEMFKTFNMGIGMMIIAAKDQADGACKALEAAGERPVKIGAIIKRENEPVIIE